MLSFLLPASAVLPFVVSCLIAFQDRKHETLVAWIARCGAGLNLCVQLVLAYIFLSQSGLSSEAGILNFSKPAEFFGHHFNFDLSYNLVTLVYALLTAFCCSTIVHFSRVYLHKEPGYRRFFSLLFILTAGMNILAVANNLSVFFVGWEFIGLASFFLIAFYREQKVSVNNALKVFGVYRIGDLGLLSAMICLHLISETHVGSTFSDLTKTLPNAVTSSGWLYASCFGILVAAMAKSAQFPFSFWLPRAMEGPTPSSAIFYGALSVHAGVLLLMRLHPLMVQFPLVNYLVIAVGLVTAILAFAASRTYSSIKGRLAMASVSQVGVIFIEVGLGFEKIALYHTVAHALLRSIQLLISPSVISHFLKIDGEVPSPIRRKPRSLESFLPARLRATMYVLSVQDHMVEFYLSRSFVRMQRFFQKENIIMIGLSLAVFTTLIVTINRHVSQPFTSIAIVLAFILSVYSLISRAAFTQKILMIGTSFFLVIAAARSLSFDKNMLNYGFLVVVVLSALMLIFVPQRFKSLTHVSYRGMWQKHPVRSTMLFLAGAALVGVPPSPMFFFEDVFFNAALDTSITIAILVGFTQAINGLAVFKAAAEMTMGRLSDFEHAEENAQAFNLLYGVGKAKASENGAEQRSAI